MQVGGHQVTATNLCFLLVPIVRIIIDGGRPNQSLPDIALEWDPSNETPLTSALNTTLLHASALFWYTTLVHYTGVLYWCTILVYYTGALYWGTALVHTQTTQVRGAQT